MAWSLRGVLGYLAEIGGSQLGAGPPGPRVRAEPLEQVQRDAQVLAQVRDTLAGAS